jgi:hypothetical protein
MEYVFRGQGQIAFGKNPPFAPGGSLFNKIINSPDFGIDSLYAAHVVSALANSYGFGRGSKLATRGPTRFLFIMAAVDMVKYLLINSGLDYSAQSIAKAVVCLDQSGDLKQIGDAAIQMIDDYLTKSNEDSLFTEPEFVKSQDLNSFLKSEKLGKTEEYSPKLKLQMAMAKKVFRKSADMHGLAEKLRICLSQTEDAT